VTIGFLFWLLMLLWLLFSLYWGYRVDRAGGFVTFAPLGVNFIVYVLFFLLGWQVFGFIIQGGGSHPP
jgi:hypothetical protein